MAIALQTLEAQIRFSTQIIKRLGEELNPSIDQSILELVKNSYDANASNCIVELDSITEIGGSIKIKDDGDGMDSDNIINGWLVLGESSKKANIKTRLGRIPSGSKGLGRLAALRMGTVAKLQSYPKDETGTYYELIIDWNKYDNAKLVEDVSLPVKKFKSTTDKYVQGTCISIENLRNKIGDREVTRIARGLILLSDPFDDDPYSFRPRLISEEFKEMEQLVARRYFDDADYHLVANVDKNGMAYASINDYKGNVLFQAKHSDLSKKRKGNIYECPPVTFDLWTFLLNEITFSTRPTSVGEVRAWLKEFGGVHLYENGLRVSPYGNPGNDWLDMNLSRAKSPEERPSTNTSIGAVRIKDSGSLLSQKTDRSGFIENDVFHEIKSFCKDALDWMARRRLEVAEKKRSAERQRSKDESSGTKESLENEIKLLSASRKSKVQKAFVKYENARKNEIKALKSEIQLYRTLSTAGITAATFSHESRGNSIKAITVSLKTIDKRIKEHIRLKYDELFKRPIDIISNSLDSLAVLGNATLSLLQREKRRPIKVSIHKIIETSIEILLPFFDGRDIKVNTDLTNGNPFVRASEAAIESIVTNLLNNSIVALEDTTIDRQIFIKTIVEESVLSIIVSDNGPGIKGINIRDIWLPGETTNQNGTGLGLTIVRDAVLDLGGKVSANANGAFGGAEFIIEIPILGI
jgi:signal transduction histidine kinase